MQVYVSATPNTAILQGTMYLQVAEDEIGDWEVLDWPEGSSPELLQSFRRLTITFRKVNSKRSHHQFRTINFEPSVSYGQQHFTPVSRERDELQATIEVQHSF